MTNPLRNFSLALEALTALRPEIEAVSPLPLASAPSLADSLAELGPLPRESLLLGLASDGLPVLLNLHDPSPGPLLVTADAGAGKTALLQLIASAAAEMHSPGEVQFGIITNYPDEWEMFASLEHCVGVFPAYHNAAIDFLHSLSGWAHANKGGKQSVLLLLDDLESVERMDFEARQTLRWLLLRGTARKAWPIVTVNADGAAQVEVWLEAFRTRIFGQVKDSHLGERLAGVPAFTLSTLQGGLQFALREGEDWLKFWIPDVGWKDGER